MFEKMEGWQEVVFEKAVIEVLEKDKEMRLQLSETDMKLRH